MIEIAIDGTAASGKGTLAKKLSLKYGLPHLDTGLMYRRVALNIIINNKNNEKNLELVSCKSAKEIDFKEKEVEKLRSEEVATLASKIASFPKLRQILNDKQTEFVDVNKKKFGGCILDGRDIGTKILPNADFKFFISASIEVRAKRRLLEKNISFLHENDEKCMLHNLINEMSMRDISDKDRLVSPLVPAKDALIIDTSSIDAEQLLSIATRLIEGKSKSD